MHHRPGISRCGPRAYNIYVRYPVFKTKGQIKILLAVDRDRKARVYNEVMPGRKGYYRSIPGSRTLGTRKEEKQDLFLKIETELEESPGLGPMFELGNETLGGVVVKGDAAWLPNQIFDALLKKLEPIEQAVYLQLFRLAYGTGKNFCRVGKKELAERAGLSLVRLNASLEGLVRKKMAKPVHRSVRGTLWRVYHPGELGEKVAYKVEEGKRVKLKAPAPKTEKPSPIPERPLESPLNVEKFKGISADKTDLPIKKIAEKFFELKDKKPGPDELDDAQSVITALLEDGFSRKQVLFAVSWFCEKFPKEKDLSRIPYYISRALEEFKEG